MKDLWEVTRRNIYRGLYYIYHAENKIERLRFTVAEAQDIYNETWGEGSFKAWTARSTYTIKFYIVVSEFLLEYLLPASGDYQFILRIYHIKDMPEYLALVRECGEDSDEIISELGSNEFESWNLTRLSHSNFHEHAAKLYEISLNLLAMRYDLAMGFDGINLADRFCFSDLI